MSGLFLDHLWQSTLFAALAGLLVLTLRGNGARVRYYLWFAASVKFLVPFAALTALGSLVPATPVAAPGLVVWRQVAMPFAARPILPLPMPAGPDWAQILPPVLLGLWAIGFVAIAARWLRRWSRLQDIVGQAQDCALPAPVPVKMAPSLLEPGLVGIWRPVILLPQGITERLSQDELDAILAHEICHLRRRDNLTAATHMLVEALFWFHPLVWWLGARLNAEREQACDESVLAAGQPPQIYATSILKVCQLYLHSPLDCAAGISGADLKTRMETIMENRIALPLNRAKKMLLAGAAALAIVAPLAAGLLTAPPVFAQAAAPRTAQDPRSEAALRSQIEGWRKHQPALGAMSPQMARFAGQDRDGMQKKFDALGAVTSITFKGVEENKDYYLVDFAHGRQTAAIGFMPDGKIAMLEFSNVIVRSNPNGPEPGTEAALRRFINGLVTGNPDYADLPPKMAQSARRRGGMKELSDLQPKGALKSIVFRRVTVEGLDQYEVVTAQGHATWTVGPLVNGKMASFGMTVSDDKNPHLDDAFFVVRGD